SFLEDLVRRFAVPGGDAADTAGVLPNLVPVQQVTGANLRSAVDHRRCSSIKASSYSAGLSIRAKAFHLYQSDHLRARRKSRKNGTSVQFAAALLLRVLTRHNGGMSSATILGPDGVIAGRLSNYESRPQQLQMAEAVARAIAEPHHL